MILTIFNETLRIVCNGDLLLFEAGCSMQFTVVVVNHAIRAANRTVVGFTHSFAHALRLTVLVYPTVTTLLAHFRSAWICIRDGNKGEKRGSI